MKDEEKLGRGKSLDPWRRSFFILHPSSFILLFLLAFLVSGCGKRMPPPAVPPPTTSAPPVTTAPSTASAPRLEARVEPESIRSGESALLIWEASDAEVVAIDHEIGEVDKSGRLKVFPTQTTTYRIVAAGPGGNTEKRVTLEVGQQPQPGIFEEELAGKPLAERFAYFVKPVFFPYDSAELGDEAKLTLDGNIRWLVGPENRGWTIVIEGHTDERGTAEYNLALGDKRAQVVRAYMAEHGVDPNRLITISLGEERPFDPRPTEDAYAFNRRAHFVLLQEQVQQP